MALTFINGSPNRVDFGDYATNPEACTILAWVYPTATTVGRFLTSKTNATTGGGYRNLALPGFVGTRQFQFNIDYGLELASGDDAIARSADNSWNLNEWNLIGATFDGTNAPKLWRGSLTSQIAEVSYAIQQAPTGARVSDNNNPLIVGNRYDINRAFPGRIAWIGIWNRAFALGELLDQQFRPHVTSGIQVFSHLGFNGTGTQPDWSGNGNNGTVTGATVGDHVPIFVGFGFDFGALSVAAAVGGVVVTINDVGMGADQTSLEASMSLPEEGSGGDNLSLLASLALSEIGSGADSPELAASLGIPDSGSGDDEFIDLLASLSPQEFGQGTDSIAQLLATLVTSDIGIGVDDPVLAALLGIGDQGSGDDEFIDLSANLSTLDSGFGTDTVSQILASLSVSEGGSGSESTTIQVTLSVTDQGTGTDAINVLKAILKLVTDTAFGLDGTSISVILSSGDTAFGTDSPTIQAQLVISDTSSASDIVNVLKAIIKTVSDIGTGTEGIQITASIPVSESGIGTDQIAQILASLLVSDVGTGVDIVIVTVTTPSGAQIIKISFIIKKSTIDFAVAKPAINFELEQPSISFDLLSGG